MRAAALGFSASKKGVQKVSPWTSIPCSWISLTETMLSSPPEKREMALTVFFVSVENKIQYPLFISL